MIAWKDATWNPVRGCTKVSPGCKHCYAELFAERWRGVAGHPYEQGFDLRLVPEKLTLPLTWGDRCEVFVTSMSDLFHEGVPDAYVDAVARVMEATPWHNYQVLTRRSARLRDLLRGRLARIASLPHVWWGVSVEDRRFGLPRIEDLRAAPVGLRFLSIEPLLEDLREIDLTGIHWVLVGGESGPGARPMAPEWVRALRDQCGRARVPFFFKQWGGVSRKSTGRILDGQTHDAAPERAYEVRPVPGRAERRRLAEAIRGDLPEWPSELLLVRAGRPGPVRRLELVG